MEQIFTFPFTVITMPSYRTKIDLGQKHGRWPTVNPWIADLEWRNEMAGCNFELRASLWGSSAPWRADEALAEIAEASGGVAQDPTLEAAVPDALYAFKRLVQGDGSQLMAQLVGWPVFPARIVFPGLGASWNHGADVSVEHDPYRRRNSLGRRTAKAISCELVASPRKDEAFRFVLGVGRLFPCTLSGEEYPHPTDSFLLQIHR